LRQSIASSKQAICDAEIATTPSVACGQMKRPRSSRLGSVDKFLNRKIGFGGFPIGGLLCRESR
jgi:hypothetical protein